MRKIAGAFFAIALLTGCGEITRQTMRTQGTLEIDPSPVSGATHRIKIIEVRGGEAKTQENARKAMGWEKMEVIEKSSIESGLSKPFWIYDVRKTH